MKFITKGKGQGRKVIPLGGKAKVPVSKDKAVDYTDYRTSKRYLEDRLDKSGDISRHNWSIGKDRGGIEVTLGNMTDAGWYWSGRVKEFAGFLIRMVSSKVRQEYIDAMRNNGVDFRKVRGVILKSVDEGDGLYEMTGDNARWKFGSTVPEVDEDMEFENFAQDRGITLTDEFKDAVRNEFYPDGVSEYDEFSKPYVKRYKDSMREAILQSDTFEEHLDKVADIRQEFDYDIMEDMSEKMGAGFRTAMLKVAKEQKIL